MVNTQKERCLPTEIQSPAKKTKTWKTRGALLKIVGTFILLLSFAAQNFFYDRSNSRTNELVSAMHDRQMIDKGAMLQELLYFAAINSTNTLKGISASDVASSKIKLSAIKVAGSASVAVNAAKIITPDEATVLLNELFGYAGQVKDYKDLASLFSYVNDKLEPHAKALNTEYEKESKKRTKARTMYLRLYLSGAFLLLLGLVFELKGINE